MGTQAEASAHLTKAREFLEAAQHNLELGLLNASTSNAVSSGVNSKDAICLKLTGKTDKNADHQQAAGELKRSGASGAALSLTLSRLLALKSKSHYQADSVPPAEAAKATAWATRLFEGAKEILSA